MKILKYCLLLFWRIWFYGWVIGTILVALPILLIVISHERFYKAFFKMAIAWGKTILFVMGFHVKVEAEEEIVAGKSYMFIANHTSMIDIMLMLSVIKNPAVFVGKEELTKIPVFGYVFKRTCITVDRGCFRSRKEVYDKAQKKIDDGLGICIFPEGMVPGDESIVLSEFKNGAFHLAVEHEIPVVPMTFYDCKKCFSYTFFSGGPGTLRVKIHKFIDTEGVDLREKGEIKKKAFDIIYNELTSDAEKDKASVII